MASTWAGAPPVSENGFVFINNEFFAESSGRNQHRRATKEELKSHFDSGHERDHPAHWFEAQLLHYGLRPSKTKSVARMRLFDALRNGELSVPSHINQLEGKLKKEWTKNNKGVKKVLKDTDTKEKPKRVAAGAKRKIDVNVTVSISDTTAEKPAKKKKTATSSSAKPKRSVRKDDNPSGSSSQRPVSTVAARASSSGTSAPTARARRGGHSQGPSRNSTETATSPPAQRFPQKQTARRSNAFVARGRISAPAVAESHDNDNDYREAPPPYSEYNEDDYDNEESSGDDDDDWENTRLEPLGLLNGSYDITAPYVTEQWSTFDDDDFQLTLTLSGRSLWGRFNLGIIEGVIVFDERPWQSSHEPISFRWRGREDQGPIIFGHNEGWIKFLGDGRIQGEFDYQRIAFRGRRCSGQGTRSAVDARVLKNEWSGYSEEEYEREARDRW